MQLKVTTGSSDIRLVDAAAAPGATGTNPGSQPPALVPAAPVDLSGKASLGPVSSGSAVGGQLHHVNANPARVAGAAARKRIEVLLATPVTVRSAQEVRAALIIDCLGQRQQRTFLNEKLIPGLAPLVGTTLPLGELLAELKAIYRPGLYSDPLLIPSKLVTQPALLSELASLRRLAAAEDVVVTPLPQIRALLARDPDQALALVAREAPHSAGILPDLLKLGHYGLDDVVVKLSVHALPYLVGALESPDPTIVERAAEQLANLEAFAAPAAPALLRAYERLEHSTDDDTRITRENVLRWLAGIAPEFVAAHPRMAELTERLFTASLMPVPPVGVLCQAGERALPFVGRLFEREETAIEVMSAIGPAAWAVAPRFLAGGTLYRWVELADALGPPDAAAAKALMNECGASIHPSIAEALLCAPADIRDAFADTCLNRGSSYSHLSFAAQAAALQPADSPLRAAVKRTLEPLLPRENYYGMQFHDLLRVASPSERTDLIRRALAMPNLESVAARELIDAHTTQLSEEERVRDFSTELIALADGTRAESAIVSGAGRLLGRSPEARAEAIARCVTEHYIDAGSFAAVRELIGAERAVDAWFAVLEKRPDQAFMIFADVSGALDWRRQGTAQQRATLLALYDNPSDRDREHFARFDRVAARLREAAARDA